MRAVHALFYLVPAENHDLTRPSFPLPRKQESWPYKEPTLRTDPKSTPPSTHLQPNYNATRNLPPPTQFIMSSLTIPNTYIQDEAVEYLDSPVIAIFAVCGPPVDREIQGTTVNHWRLFFVLQPKQQEAGRSVILDMVKTDGNDTTGLLGVTTRPFNVTNSRVHEVGMVPMTADKTVRGVLEMLNREGMMRYRYTNHGEGCRFWIWTVVQFLQNEDYLQEGSSQRLRASLERIWRSDAEEGTVQAMGKGTFY